MPQSHARRTGPKAATTPSLAQGSVRAAPARSPAAPVAAPVAAQHCDFCGAEVATVRRVALDRDYDRLQQGHRELYACGPCSERKESRRLGLDR